MAINSIGNNNFLLGQSIQGLKSQLDTLQTQLSTGTKSTVYSGMGTNEGFAIFARAQLSNLSAFTTTMTRAAAPAGSTAATTRAMSRARRMARRRVG